MYNATSFADGLATPIPKNSETFLPPATCKHKGGEEAKREQAVDRERMVCMVGLDVHYELNVVAQEPGSHQPRLKPFNPRMSGPACPYNYTGKFLNDEAKHRALASDPIKHGREIEKQPPYDPPLYAVRDPRLVSKTVVIRDYGCKVPIDLADTEKIARAVLNHYPDQYIAFLGEFVENLFGTHMRTFLETQRAGLRRLLQDDAELNRVSWGAYRSVQGGVDHSAPPSEPRAGATPSEETDWKNYTQADATLVWRTPMDHALSKLAQDGRAMTGACSSQDVYDLRPCLRQHIETLTEMIDVWCRGFGTSEHHALALLWWCNDQGRKMCDDLKLINESQEVDFDKVELVVPVDLYRSAEETTTSIEHPDLDPFVRSKLRRDKGNVRFTRSMRYKVGRWSGTADTMMTFMSAAPRAPFNWGFGHPANLMQKPDDKFAPRYLKYKPGSSGTGYELEANMLDTTFVVNGWSKLPALDGSGVIHKDTSEPRVTSVRASLITPDNSDRDAMYRATVAKEEAESEELTVEFEPYKPETFTPLVSDVHIDASQRCANSRTDFSLVSKFASSACQTSMDAVVGKACIRVEDGVTIHPDAIKAYPVSKIVQLVGKTGLSKLFGDETAALLNSLPAWDGSSDIPDERAMRVIAPYRYFDAPPPEPDPKARKKLDEIFAIDVSKIVTSERVRVDLPEMEEVTQKKLRLLIIRNILALSFGPAWASFVMTKAIMMDEDGTEIDPSTKTVSELIDVLYNSVVKDVKFLINVTHDSRRKEWIDDIKGYLKAKDDRVINAILTLFKQEPPEGKYFVLPLELIGRLQYGYQYCATHKVATEMHELANGSDETTKFKSKLFEEIYHSSTRRAATMVLDAIVNPPRTYGAVAKSESSPDYDDIAFNVKRNNKNEVTHADTINPIRGEGDLSHAPQELDESFLFVPLDKKSETPQVGSCMYNADLEMPQFFAMLDASGLLWKSRAYVNPADCMRPQADKGRPLTTIDGMHYWCRTLTESFVASRELFKARATRTKSSDLWEASVKMAPARAFPSSQIGEMCDESWRRHFPLLPLRHKLRDDLRRLRAMDVLWGTLPSYTCQTTGGSSVQGAWMPLSVAHHVRLMKSAGLYDETYRVPRNPWCAHGGTGLSRVFNQSYHSVYHTDSYQAAHFQDWMNTACRYQCPVAPGGGDERCYYPFSQYGGTPVEADFVHHMVEKCEDPGAERRHAQLVYNRFGVTQPLRLGQQYRDTGLLQDLFSYKYRQFAHLSQEQREMTAAKAVWPSNFLSYARNHAIIALASCNQGTEEASVPRIVRNLYRLYVDTYECMGGKPDDDGVPAIMGFLPTPVNDPKEDRPIMLYAGSLSCLNSKLERFCNGPGNKDERVCPMYKQVYLNDATLLFTRMLRQRYRSMLHEDNYRRARVRRGGRYEWTNFQGDLIELQDAYIEFLQTTVLGLLFEMGADLNNAPLHLLEPRELEVSMLEEDDSVLGNDYLTPRTKEIVKMMDFSGDTLNRTQLAILSLIPPNHRILGTMRLNQQTDVVDLEHIKKQIQKDTMESNKTVWKKYLDHLISGAFAQKLLEVDGPIDFSFDMSSIRDPLKEAAAIPKRLSTTNAQSSSSLSQSIRADALRQETGPDSVLGMNKAELNRALEAVAARVERDFQKHDGALSRNRCLSMLRVPEHVKRILRPRYE